MVTETKITHLRSLPDNFTRGNTCLSWAEQERQRYYDGQRQMQDRRVAELPVRRPTEADLRVARTQGNIDWAATTACKEIKALETMYGRWADTYFAAHTAEMLGKMYHQSR